MNKNLLINEIMQGAGQKNFYRCVLTEPSGERIIVFDKYENKFDVKEVVYTMVRCDRPPNNTLFIEVSEHDIDWFAGFTHGLMTNNRDGF